MSALHMIWASSAAGAAIFFALGFVVRALARGKPEGGAPPRGERPGGEADDEVERLRLALAASDSQRAELSRQIQARSLEAREAADEAARLREALSRSGPGVVDLQGGAAAEAGEPTPPSDEETTKVNRQSAELLAAVEEVASLRERLGALEQVAKEAQAARDAADDETETLARKLANAERALERESARRAKAEKERLEAKTELATMRAESKAIEEARGALASGIASGKGLQGKVDALRQENAELRLEVDRLADAREQLVAAKAAKDEAERRLREVETEAHTLRADADRADRSSKTVSALERQNAELRDAGRRAEAAEGELARARQDIEALKRELREARAASADRLAEEQAGGVGTAEVEAARAEIAALKVEARRADMRMTELELLREENQNLRAEIGEMERLRREATEVEKLQLETSQLRVETEVGKRKVAELEEVALEKASLAAELEELRPRAAEVDGLRERVSALEAQLFAAGIEPKPATTAEPERGDRTSYVGLDVALSSLAAVANLRAAVVADDMGLVIAGAGRTEYHEDVAALSGLARHLAERAQDLLPLDEIQQIVLEDLNRVVITCRLFSSGSESFALSMLGTSVPPPRELVDKHVRSLLKTLA